MIVDTSALVAILLREPGFEELVEKLLAADAVGIGAPTLVETSAVLLSKLGSDPTTVLEPFLARYEVTVVPFGEAHWREAASAYRRFGRARHPAGLNFGDCLSYATARLARQPLLCVGRDFPQTDLVLA